MKNNQLTAMLVGILFITTGASAWLALRYTSAFHKRQQLAPTLASIHYTEGMISALANDTIEYSKKNPAIDPILKSFNLMPSGNPPPANGRPATR